MDYHGIILDYSEHVNQIDDPSVLLSNRDDRVVPFAEAVDSGFIAAPTVEVCSLLHFPSCVTIFPHRLRRVKKTIAEITESDSSQLYASRGSILRYGICTTDRIF